MCAAEVSLRAAGDENWAVDVLTWSSLDGSRPEV